MSLIAACIAETRRTYPAGYGFALAYLTQSPGVDELRAMRGRADTVAANAICYRRSNHVDSDVLAYVKARHDQPHNGGWPWWLIEAAQLVLSDAMAGGTASARVMAQWGHPGY